MAPFVRLVLIVLTLGAVSAPPVLAQPRGPSFGSYRAALYRGRIAAPNFQRAPQYRQFRTRIVEGARTVNFAGRYALVRFGCGAGCTSNVVVDVSSGRIIDFPLGGEDNYHLDLNFRADSRLVRARWETQGADEACIHQALVFNGRTFRRLPARRQAGACANQPF